MSLRDYFLSLDVSSLQLTHTLYPSFRGSSSEFIYLFIIKSYTEYSKHIKEKKVKKRTQKKLKNTEKK